MKRCSRCGRTLPTSAFYRRSDRPEGLLSICRGCTAEKNRTQYVRSKAQYGRSRPPTTLDRIVTVLLDGPATTAAVHARLDPMPRNRVEKALARAATTGIIHRDFVDGHSVWSLPTVAHVDMGWRDRANCRGTDVDMFPLGLPGWRGDTTGDAVAISAAVAVCQPCPVRNDCLSYALALGPSDVGGVWGGTTVEDRQTLRRMLNLEVAV